ncbi:hypothetical protein BWQ96_07404 [Gracilariopsis chorda]|uniref:Uncharacterized protein n=1 Tax=Gracilariopsis chorda TaxID=448386 RepID=A0A2V3IP07_9FLOR|nr:hypothetical protein BWQ96_07404 [Gracilariopsis chorda]|eukprot:PXF42860.1 hypothetical protein BWQ96_07404 [Gracilariopsis chorda]
METASRTHRKKLAEERACPGNDSGDIQDLPTGCTGDDEHVEAVKQCAQSEPVRFQSSSPQNTGTYLTEQNLRPTQIALSPRGSRAAPVVQYCQPEQWSIDHVLMSAASVPSISGSASAVVPDLNVADAVVIDPIVAVPARSTTRKRQLRRASGRDWSSVGVCQSAKQRRILELTQEINRLKDTAD